MLSRLVVQQVKEVLDSQRDGTTGAEDHREQIVHKLLQRPLKDRGSRRKENDLVWLLSNNVHITGWEECVSVFTVGTCVPAACGCGSFVYMHLDTSDCCYWIAMQVIMYNIHTDEQKWNILIKLYEIL